MHWAKARDAGLHIKHEADEFRAHARANDRRQRDWDAAFDQWLLKSVKFGAVRSAVRPERVDRVSGLRIER
jgi:hypothetical protein